MDNIPCGPHGEKFAQPSVVELCGSLVQLVCRMWMYCCARTEFYLKHLKSEVKKQIRLQESVQPNGTKPAQPSSSSSSVVMQSASVPPADLSHTALVSVFPATTHDVSLPSPSALLAQLKVATSAAEIRHSGGSNDPPR